MDFLDARGALGRHAKVNVMGTKQCGDRAALLAGERGHGDSVRLGGAECPPPYNRNLELAMVPQVAEMVAAVRKLVRYEI